MSIVNLAAYQFATLEATAAWRPLVTQRCEALGLRGTVLLAPEGINLFVAGTAEAAHAFIDYLRHDPLFEGKFTQLQFKESLSPTQPFRRMLVKLKREIITMKKPAIQPELGRAPAVDAHTLKAWLDQGHDDTGRPVVMLDTRNAFEVDVGTFDNTLDYRMTRFSEFPDVIEQHRADLEGKTVVSFCTGGIRCEKAAIYMKEIGIDHVYQLDGGILKYFEEVGGAHYHGECFVFDYRTALNPQLEPTATAQCFGCRAVLSPEAQLSPLYVPGKSCPACHERHAGSAKTTRSKAASSASTSTPAPAAASDLGDAKR
ncbi:sulfurtransferase [Paraburkholderia bonniea]|uniref:sulfurtransferase n=1 Tax=Paraburkholderia bonniea TaxID=2152891 RepID=UPI00129194D0|nr:sulfurtransferase [Paraburkholderia bonniea]WJF91641.1 sulfurtransferase [Paraburkholderia bonniea]WJF94960.1 sulfurtransferase [Paraburkholderia bonniea]